MRIESGVLRPLGTMVAYGFVEVDFSMELHLAGRLGARCLEIFPEWNKEPDPRALRVHVADVGLTIHSAHGCWGGQSIRARRVDLGHPDRALHRESVDDLKRCVDWLSEAGGQCLIVHPGGLSDRADEEARRSALARGLSALGEHAHGTGVVICVENMPPGVHPGSRIGDLSPIVSELHSDRVALALDTGHAHISSDVHSETIAAGNWLRSTHVHDNDGRQDSHLPPGLGSIDWEGWTRALDAIDYRGPIMLECVRHLRKNPEGITDRFLDLLERMRTRDT